MIPRNPLHAQYEVDLWVDEEDGRVYVRVEAIEFERATLKTFELAGKRRVWAYAAKHGAPEGFAKGVGSIEVWDRALDYASDLPVAYVFRTRDPLVLHEALERA